MARGAWDRTAALMYAIVSSSFGGVRGNLKADNLNPYRNAKRGLSLADWFGAMRQAKAEQEHKQEATGEAHGG